MLLALDSSSNVASLALLRDSSVAADLRWNVGRRHSQELIAHLDALLAQVDAKVADLTAVAVALGPGSFNGVRVGVTAAKTLAMALAIPLCGVCTLDVIASGVAAEHAGVCAVLEAGRGEVYRALYRAATSGGARVTDQLVRTSDYAILTVPALAEELGAASADVVLAGEWPPALQDTLAALGIQAQFAQPKVSRAALLGAIAVERGRRGERDEPATMEPVYLRRPNLTQPASRGAGAVTGA
jgi:tRNA threonylcarbamoyladenosine biosynthesis protein TsaB